MNSSTENSNNIAETLKTHCPKLNLKALQKNRVCHECSGSNSTVYVWHKYRTYMYGCIQYTQSGTSSVFKQNQTIFRDNVHLIM